MGQRIKILVIDSEEIILKSVRKALKNNNDFEYVVTVCNSAIESLKLIRGDSFDLVFIDLVLPGMNGIEVLRRIKNITPTVSVIIMTGFSSTEINTKTAGEGSYLSEIMKSASGILFKPFTTEEINNMVSQTLKHVPETNG